MSRLGNFTLGRFFNHRKEAPTSAASDEILLAQMEIFIIVVAVIAVAAAIILLALLQLRIKKQTTTENPTEVSRETRVRRSIAEEIALDYPNDEILKNGPPPYRRVMKSLELYPLASSTGNVGDVKIQIPTSPLHNQRTRRTWNQFLNAVLHYDDDQGLNVPSENTSKNSYINNSAVVDEVLPSYNEVTGEESTVESCQNMLSRRESVDIIRSGKYDILGFNFGIEKTKLCKNDCVFTTFNTLQTVIAVEEFKQPSSRPRLATL